MCPSQLEVRAALLCLGVPERLDPKEEGGGLVPGEEVAIGLTPCAYPEQALGGLSPVPRAGSQGACGEQVVAVNQ